MQGRVVYWNAARGFGFVKRDEGGADAMVHIYDVKADVDAFSIGQRVCFDLGIDQRSGKPRAKNVEVV